MKYCSTSQRTRGDPNAERPKLLSCLLCSFENQLKGVKITILDCRTLQTLEQVGTGSNLLVTKDSFNPPESFLGRDDAEHVLVDYRKDSNPCP